MSAKPINCINAATRKSAATKIRKLRAVASDPFLLIEFARESVPKVFHPLEALFAEYLNQSSDFP